jgi:RNA polymerase sigma factor (sigma-70 family)
MAANHRRGSSRFTDAVQLMYPLIGPGHDAMTDAETRRDFVQACGNLTRDEKEAIFYTAEGMTDREIGKIVGAMPATVRRRLHRARHKLRQAMRDYAGDQHDGRPARTGGHR